MKKNFFVALLILATIGVFFGIIFHIKWLDFVFKPLIMVSIAGYFVLHSRHINKNFVILSLFAFLFSFFGDVLLMFSEKAMKFFVLGLFSFLIAQIFYILLFLKSIRITGGTAFLRKNYIYLAGYIIYGGLVYFILLPQLDIVLKVAVFVYMLAITGMSAMALNRYKAVNASSFLPVFLGSILFVISDSLIAIDKFVITIPFDRLIIMSTYIAAQFLIMRGILKQFKSTG